VAGIYSVGENQFKNLHIVARRWTRTAREFSGERFSNTVSWSPDGTFMLFDSGQRTESTQLARVDLVPRTPRFREDQFRDLFREETPRNTTPRRALNLGPSPLKHRPPAPCRRARQTSDGPAQSRSQSCFEDIRRRLSLLPVGVDVTSRASVPTVNGSS
jgi:hypothetical protein